MDQELLAGESGAQGLLACSQCPFLCLLTLAQRMEIAPDNHAHDRM